MISVQECALEGVKLITPKVFEDSRGFVSETVNEKRLSALGLPVHFVQENLSYSHKAGTVRGLHFQCPPHAQAKLIRVLKGRIYDVAVDLRRSSSTYGQHVAVTLSDENLTQFFIPRGFAHGFCSLSDEATVLYKIDSFYAPESEGGVFWNDPDLKINWPVPAQNPLLSDKDLALPRLKDIPPLEW